MYVKRNLEELILKFLDSREIIAVLGARQTGKTTMVKHLMEGIGKSVSISFDDQNILRLFEEDTDKFISIYVSGNKYLFIDEFQYAKEGGRILKYIFDTQKIKIIISGSLVGDLTIRALKYLVGRVLIFNLYPFDFREFMRFKDSDYLTLYEKYAGQTRKWKNLERECGGVVHKKLLQYYEEYLIYGGYPRVATEKDYQKKKEILRNIYNTYFLREVRDILGLIDDYKLSKLINALALQIGNLIEYAELSRLSEYSYPSLRKYLNFLEKTFIIKMVRPYYKNKRSEIVKNPKVYFIDTGLRNSVVDDFRDLEQRPDKGALLENGLFGQFTKRGLNFNFWRDKKGNELDFIIPLGNGKTIAVESKSYLKSSRISSIESFRKKYPEINIFLSYQDINQAISSRQNIWPIYLY